MIEAFEDPEDTFVVFQINTNAVIPNFDANAVGAVFSGDAHVRWSGGRNIFEGVAEEIGDDLGGKSRVGQRGLILNVNIDASVLSADIGLEVFEDLLDEGAKFERLQLDLLASGRAVGEEVAKESGH